MRRTSKVMCKDHPSYRGGQQPRSQCVTCWKLYEGRRFIWGRGVKRAKKKFSQGYGKCNVCGLPDAKLQSPGRCVNCDLAFAQADWRAESRVGILNDMRASGIPLLRFNDSPVYASMMDLAEEKEGFKR